MANHSVRERSLLEALGVRVRRLRNDRGWSRRELAARTELSERFLAQVETGEGNPSVSSLSRIAQALETTPADLLAVPRLAVPALLAHGRARAGRAQGGGVPRARCPHRGGGGPQPGRDLRAPRRGLLPGPRARGPRGGPGFGNADGPRDGRRDRHARRELRALASRGD